MKALNFITALCFLCAIGSAQAADNMKAFPPSEDGMVRYVLQVPKQDGRVHVQSGTDSRQNSETR